MKRQRPSRHIRRVRTKRGLRARLINPGVLKRFKHKTIVPESEEQQINILYGQYLNSLNPDDLKLIKKLELQDPSTELIRRATILQTALNERSDFIKDARLQDAISESIHSGKEMPIKLNISPFSGIKTIKQQDKELRNMLNQKSDFEKEVLKNSREMIRLDKQLERVLKPHEKVSTLPAKWFENIEEKKVLENFLKRKF